MLHQHAIEATAAQELQCPSCGLLATISDRFTLHDSPGAVEHVSLAWFAPSIESLPDWLGAPRGAEATHTRTPATTGGLR